MAFCGNCGVFVEEGVKFCPECGQSTAPAGQQQPPPQQAQRQQGYAPPVVPGAPQQADIRDAQDNKAMAIISYILFFIPLLTGAHKTSPFVKYHTNQGAALFIVAVAYSVVSAILRAIIKTPVSLWGVTVYYTPGWLNVLLWLISIPIFILCVVGIINAVNGRMRPLPAIGGFSLIK